MDRKSSGDLIRSRMDMPRTPHVVPQVYVETHLGALGLE